MYIYARMHAGTHTYREREREEEREESRNGPTPSNTGKQFSAIHKNEFGVG